ncbi:MAG: hypothetical protein KY454_04235 [Actinobacteria bacterium]|nr:hypothetical protein [Actinomycetota bacterium]
MTLPRLVALMGSGETSPTMVKTHRQLLSRLGPPPVPAVLLDTPFGFQGNAADLTRRAQSYFRDSVGHPIEVAGFRSASEIGSVAYESMLSRLRSARYVFAGPGSPTYALRQWTASAVPQVLRDKLATGGCVSFASAAALTLGVVTVPVYEIYKVGESPRWEQGLDLLAGAGLSVAVIPHYNNAEGGSHDTRFCYLGEDRLAEMERDLPAGAFVLGVDEHTGLVIDLTEGSATVVGIGVVTVRAGGHSAVLEPGTVTTPEALRAMAEDLRGAGSAVAGGGAAGAAASSMPDTDTPSQPVVAPLLQILRDREAAFEGAMAVPHVSQAVQTVLDLQAELDRWGADTEGTDVSDQGRALLRAMVVRLGELALTARDSREVVGPFVEALLSVRSNARRERRYGEADAVRDLLSDLGVEVRDSPSGTEWDLLTGGPEQKGRLLSS